MLSTVLLITIAAIFLCVGFFIGGIYTLLFSIFSAVTATAALITAIKKWRKKSND